MLCLPPSPSTYTIQARFSHALCIVHSIANGNDSQISRPHWLRLYGLYQQAVEGDCDSPRPSSKSGASYEKWHAWHRFRGLRPLQAQERYIKELRDILLKHVSTQRDGVPSIELREALACLGDNELFTSQDEDYFVDALESTQQQALDLRIDSSEIPPLAEPVSDAPHTPDPMLFLEHKLASPKLYERPYSKAMDQVYNNKHHPNNSTMSDSDTVGHRSATPHVRRSPLVESLYDTVQQSPDQHDEAHHSLAEQRHHSHQQKDTKDFFSERFLESLQTEVAVLSEQIDHLRHTISIREAYEQQMHWSWIRFAKTVVKHTAVNCFILFLIFLVLWRRRSPIAYAIIAYVGPQIRDIIRYLIRCTLFWRRLRV